MRRSVPVFLVLFFVLVFFDSRAHALVKVEGRYWFTDLDSSVKVTEGNIIGTEIDVVDDLGVDDKKNFWEGRITLELGSHKLRYGYMPMKWDGQKTISQDIVFKGKTYTASTVVDSEMEIKYHRLAYEYDIIDTLDNRLGIIFEVKYFDINASLRDTTLVLDESESLDVPLPTVGVAVNVGLPFLLNVGGEVTGMTLGSYGYMVDAEAMVNFEPLPFVTLSGGYRYLKLHVAVDDDEGDFTLSGPYLVLRAGF